MKALNFLTAVLCLSATAAVAQQTPEATFYKLDFVVKEVDAGKVINTRNYSTILAASGKDRGLIRTGNRVPVTSEKTVGVSPVTQFQYLDVGINIDSGLLRELPGDRVAVEMGVDITSNVASETAGLPPIIRQNKWQSTVVVPVRKASTIFSSDDPSSKRQMQIELTATPLK
jgi:hypothetical protein